MISALVRMSTMITVFVLCMLYPYLPGRYDALAITLSTMAQAFGVLGLLLAPMGVAWQLWESRKRARAQRNLPLRMRGYFFALAAMIVAVLIAAALALVAAVSHGYALGLSVFALSAFMLWKIFPKLKLWRNTESIHCNAAPLYLIFLPLTVLLLQLAFAQPMTEFSRNRAIAQSAALINDIERYHAAHGHYPRSLLALHPDYEPGIVGIQQFYYTPQGEAFNVFFEQPRFLLDDFGVREIVMYNKRDEHMMISHTAWILLLSPEDLQTRQGWFAMREASAPHWKSFWFD